MFINLEHGLTLQVVAEAQKIASGAYTSAQTVVGYGELTLQLDDTVMTTLPLRALQENPAGSLWQRSRDTVLLWFE